MNLALTLTLKPLHRDREWVEHYKRAQYKYTCLYEIENASRSLRTRLHKWIVLSAKSKTRGLYYFAWIRDREMFSFIWLRISESQAPVCTFFTYSCSDFNFFSIDSTLFSRDCDPAGTAVLYSALIP